MYRDLHKGGLVQSAGRVEAEKGCFTNPSLLGGFKNWIRWEVNGVLV
jgi:hypothetical protein